MSNVAHERPSPPEFSARTRALSLQRFREEFFDFLIIGGGITGAAVAREAAARGYSVALIERRDFSFGTSSRSSKLIHGGLRYLEKLEFSLVMESLRERKRLLQEAPHLVKPLEFYWPSFEGDRIPSWKIGLGLSLYDLLASFSAPDLHRRLTAHEVSERLPQLKSAGLLGGFTYHDAMMWDDVLAVETLRQAAGMGAAVANYVEALTPLWENHRVVGFSAVDADDVHASELQIRANQIIICTGAYTDEFMNRMTDQWTPVLNCSQGTHLVFPWERLPLPGAVVMNNAADGRVSFAIPRPELGEGVTIVGTTDESFQGSADDVSSRDIEIEYLMDRLNYYFPEAALKREDMISKYVGVRPLVKTSTGPKNLQAVSREHFIGVGPGQSVYVVGGKYTTHRPMAVEIVDEAISTWRKGAQQGYVRAPNPSAAPKREAAPKRQDRKKFLSGLRDLEAQGVPHDIVGRYANYARTVEQYHVGRTALIADEPGFSWVEAQVRYAQRHEMAIHLEDVYFRRLPIFLAKKDHGLTWARRLSEVWAEDLSDADVRGFQEMKRLEAEIFRRSERG